MYLVLLQMTLFSVRYRLHGLLLAKNGLKIIRQGINMNEKILSHFIAEKIISRNNIVQQHENSRGKGGGGSKGRSALRGGIYTFWNYT